MSSEQHKVKIKESLEETAPKDVESGQKAAPAAKKGSSMGMNRGLIAVIILVTVVIITVCVVVGIVASRNRNNDNDSDSNSLGNPSGPTANTPNNEPKANPTRVHSSNQATFNQRPNIIFIATKDLGYGDLASYGHPYAVTPNLDRLAREGTSFWNFHTTGSVSSTSTAAFMASRNPSWYPNYTVDFGFLGTLTITEMLKQAGYYVGHIGGWNFGPRPNEKNNEYNRYGIDYLKYTGDGTGGATGKEENRFDEAIQFLEEFGHNSQPFYLQIYTFGVYPAIDPPIQLRVPFSELQVNRLDFNELRIDEVFNHIRNKNGAMQRYLGELYGLDLNIGRLLDRLDQLGLTKDTLVAFVSENGPGRPQDAANSIGYTNGLRGRKNSFYEGGVRTPFILRWPDRIPANTRNEISLISSLDWVPTIAGIAGQNVPFGQVEGEDISDILTGSERSRTYPLFWRTLSSQRQASMLYGRWKIYKDSEELYDLQSDRSETNNLFKKEKQVRNAMLDSLAQWENSLPRTHRREGEERDNSFDPKAQAIIIPPPNGDFR